MVKVNQERNVKVMFAYIQIIQKDSSVSYGYVSFKISKDTLSISSLKGLINTDQINIPINQISDIKEDNYYGWNRIKFNYNNTQYIFLYSGYGEFDYLKETMLEVSMA